jgi:uncharacterized protein with FMN-binding domain
VGVLLVGWQAGTAALVAQQQSSPVATGPTTSGTGNGGATSGSTGGTTTPTTTGPADGTYTGASVDTRFGAVQVQVTISGGAITDVQPLRLTDRGGTSVAISNQVAPLLRNEVLQSQSAHVQNISGGTYTTQAYLSSLQSALDQAGF